MNAFSANDRAKFRSLRQASAFLFAIPMLFIAEDFAHLYGPEGWVDTDLLAMQQGFPGLSIHHAISWASGTLHISPQVGCSLIIAIYLSLCLLFALGYAVRLAAAGLLALHISIFAVMKPYSYGVDHISSAMLFYLVLLPQKADFYCWLYIHTVRIHLCIVYFFGGLVKSLGNNWWNGEALWKAMKLPYFKPYFGLDIGWLASYPFVFVIGGLLVMVLELCYPIAMAIARIRNIWLGAIIAMHIGIAVFMNLLAFSLFMITWNIAAFMVGSYVLQKYYPKNKCSVSPSRWWRAKGAPAPDQQA